MANTSSPNKLEQAVLRAIRRQLDADDAGVFDEQLKNATVKKRENTGAGFFTYFQVNRSVRPLSGRVIGNVAARLEVLKNPMVFLVFLTDGKIDFLEGASVDESTANIDFSDVEFEIV